MENIMLQDDKKELIKIVDFGLGNVFDEFNPLKTQCGSPEYAAPELFVKGKRYGPEVDLWSLGVILYVMGTGRLPFLSPRDNQTSADERRRLLLAQINRGLAAPHERVICALSAEYKNLVKRLLTPAAQKRINIQELCRHPWIMARQKLHATLTPRLQFEDKLTDHDHEAVVDELVSLTDLSRRTVETDIAKKRFGKVGGMYNILVHEIQRSSLNRVIKAQRSSTSRPSSRALKSSLTKSAMSRSQTSKMSSTTKQLRMDNQTSIRTKPNDTFSVAEYGRNTKKIIRPLPIRYQIPVKESSNIVDRFPLRGRKPTNSSLKKVDGRPMTQPCRAKQVSPAVPSFHNNSPRPLSEQIGQTRAKPSVELQLKKKNSQQEKSSILQRASQQSPTLCVSQRLRGSSKHQSIAAVRTMGQGDNRSVDRRTAVLRLARNKANSSRIRILSALKVAKTLTKKYCKSNNETKTKRELSHDKRSETLRHHSTKKSRSVMKSLDKIKWKNCILQQGSIDSNENKTLKTKEIVHSKTHNTIPKILKQLSKKG